MRRHLGAVVLLLALTACGAPPPLACPAIAAPAGVAIDVPAGQFTRADVEVCWSGQCTRRQTELPPATAAGPTTCSASACAAPAVPTGGRHGFVEIPGLPAAPVDVTITFDNGRPRRATIHPRPIATGPACGAAGPQARLVVGPDGAIG
ncbi:hypothetical protein VSH64_38880 [Amycolatopsis rhabdoformis]|uniref:Uncharacterized protein n=1 Tax=Amycolatopsis rhabdoformis TaxID=1448059 RepID=A0ABZ1I2Y4_9PSEU|nr:hypothetical protein [Amycolatopsis rhabdoformis]WSE28740.1 hypothetical protein VSH64_38880 [Amycolatopsis rhabdoformis]